MDYWQLIVNRMIICEETCAIAGDSRTGIRAHLAFS